MRKCLIIAALGLGLAGAASAQSYGYSDYGYNQNDYRSYTPRAVDNCAKQKRDGQTSGAVVGGLIGALAGGAIGNNIDDNDHHRYRRGYRGYRGYGYGHRRHHKNDNSGNVAAGAIIGGLLGAVAGSEVGKNNVNCRTYHDSVATRGYRGDPNIAPPTRQAWPSQPAQNYPVSQPRTDTRPVRTYPAPTPQPRTQTEWPEYGNGDLYGGREPCESLTRVTRLPDGREIREQVQNCEQGEVYYERNGRRLEGGF